ncbi:VanZ family protein [Streptomyces sp. NPDC004069]
MACAGGVTWALARRRINQPLWPAAWCASVTGIIFLTLWSTGGTVGSGSCVINRSILEPFTEEQGLLDAGMLLPVGALGALTTRRLLLPWLAGTALSAVIETIQGAMPSIGRACDTSDFLTNSAGTLVGGVAALSILHQGDPRRGHRGRSRARGQRGRRGRGLPPRPGPVVCHRRDPRHDGRRPR